MKQLRLLIVVFFFLAAWRPVYAADPQSTLICFGDSITAGLNLNDGQSYPDALRRLLDAEGYHYRVLNRGISGNTTKDALARIKGIIALHPDVVLVELGGNDGLRGFPPEVMQHNLTVIVSSLLRAKIRVLMAGVTLPPNYGAQYIRRFAQVYRNVSAAQHVPLVPDIYKDIEHIPGTIQPDGTHPTAKGSELIAHTLLPALTPLLSK